MGILNVIFDFFFDGGKYYYFDSVLCYVYDMVEKGVIFIDVGGEFICFGVVIVSESEEFDRVIFVIECLYSELDCVIFVDISKVMVMREVV